MHLQEETKRSEKTYQGKVFYVTRDQAELEDGKLVQRDVVHHSGGVCVVPLTDKGTVLMVQQFRYPHAAGDAGSARRKDRAGRRSGGVRQTGALGRGRTHLRALHLFGKALPHSRI